MKKVSQIDKTEIVRLLDIFNSDKKPQERYASFDFCFNYFQGFKNKADIANSTNIQNSCLQLGFYLQSVFRQDCRRPAGLSKLLAGFILDSP